ncbi:fibrinogen-binding adhesin SdrG C-terminal domain-containing protein [Limosilactobacillus sp. RRLNB_1_1]|uniref:Fibrinogen-binding adhesin SdrG C-terminal domain-containing protein n=1 Tax=Limosilactobacillus albertensis TaxID=2759752 RepID=A0A7W3Y8K5_9LACO|nr:fibrinogen-binding adhesin SdrG C-terminal domain-containing protein [Limosilactobacillus albertensis]MBB1069824.1 fibrinogen-binding adhesin SdrG C-terminal domain-containing protein [Limosilactobacillus albertensis]MCD7117062.1 fibrinogen-binding adhesin SdrG C-terminal domain-containing protein [Limosilactobacillus albertensis]MCD7128666.1 fibrinogen-binding adhesin SdrG C-terminal domain-containing protein [Limosilactobacillus albertensis]
MDNYQAMNFYYGLLNLRAGFFRANLCEVLMLVAQSVPDENQQPETAYQPTEEESQQKNQVTPDQLEFGSFYEDGHILHNVKTDTQADFFLDPTREDTVKWHTSFTVAKDVRPADQFVVQLSPNLIIAPNGHPQKPIPDFTDQNGVVIAMGEYYPEKHQLVYTFTNYVTEHRQIIGELTGELAVDPLTTPENKFGLGCFISIDDYRKDFTIDVDYPDLDNDMFLGISSRMMQFDQDQHIFTDLIYVNPAQKDLNHAYIIFNTSDLVEDLSNAIVKPSTMRIEIYRNSRDLKLPQSYGVNLQRLREITNRFPVVEGDHLVETPLTMSFADNKMRLNFAADNTTDSYIIKVIGQYNDELNGAVRLRARLFGVDQQNVYMSNSTAAMADGIPMQAAGHAVPKAGVKTADSFADDTSADAKMDEIATNVPRESPEVVAMEEQNIDIPVDLDETDTNTEPAMDEPSVEEDVVEESSEIETAENHDTPISQELDETISGMASEEMPTDSEVQDHDAEDEMTTDDMPVESEAAESMAMSEQEETTADSSAYIVSFTDSATNPDKEIEDSTEDSESAQPAVMQDIVGGDELSIALSVPAQETVSSEADSPASAEPDSLTARTSEQPTVAQSPEPLSEEIVTAEQQVEETQEEASTAPLPMPGRRPPRRHGRFQNNGRLNHSLRHLRRF